MHFPPYSYLVTGDISKMKFTLHHECRHQKMSVFNQPDVCQPKQPKNWHFLEWVRGHSTVNITPMHLEKSKKHFDSKKISQTQLPMSTICKSVNLPALFVVMVPYNKHRGKYIAACNDIWLIKLPHLIDTASLSRFRNNPWLFHWCGF